MLPTVGAVSIVPRDDDVAVLPASARCDAEFSQAADDHGPIGTIQRQFDSFIGDDPVQSLVGLGQSETEAPQCPGDVDRARNRRTTFKNEDDGSLE